MSCLFLRILWSQSCLVSCSTRHGLEQHHQHPTGRDVLFKVLPFRMERQYQLVEKSGPHAENFSGRSVLGLLWTAIPVWEMQQTMAFLQIDASSMSVPTGNLDVRKARPCLKSFCLHAQGFWSLQAYDVKEGLGFSWKLKMNSAVLSNLLFFFL